MCHCLAKIRFVVINLKRILKKAHDFWRQTLPNTLYLRNTMRIYANLNIRSNVNKALEVGSQVRIYSSPYEVRMEVLAFTRIHRSLEK